MGARRRDVLSRFRPGAPLLHRVRWLQRGPAPSIYNRRGAGALVAAWAGALRGPGSSAQRGGPVREALLLGGAVVVVAGGGGGIIETLL